MRLRSILAWLTLVPAVAAAQPPPAPPKSPHIVLVGDSTVTEGSGWGLGFRDLVTGGATVTNTAQNGRSSKSFRDEGHWDTAIALRGDYYLIQFGHNDQPGKGPERETDPATTFPANIGRYVDEVRAIGATPILVTSLVRRTFGESDPARLTSTLGPWVEAVKRVAVDKRVPLVDLDGSSRALCERLGPAEAHRFDLKKDDGTFDTTHLDAAGSAVFARLVVDDLRRAVPALAPFLKPEPAASAAELTEDPPDLPAPLPLLSFPNRQGERTPFGRVYTRSLRLARFRQREAFNGRKPDLAKLQAVATSPAILVAWEFVPWKAPDGMTDCGFEPGAPTRVAIRPIEAHSAPPDLQPLAVLFDQERIRALFAPFESELRRIRWVAVLDPERLRPGTRLTWFASRPCPVGTWRPTSAETAVLIAQDDIDQWRRH